MTADASRQHRYIISALGRGNYNLTTYAFESQPVGPQYESTSVLEVLADRHPDYQLVIPATDEAWLEFEANRSELASRATRVHLSSDRTKDLWQMYGSLTAIIAPGSEVIADVSNGFRSLPILLLSALAYLRSVKDVEVSHIYYGAFERGNEVTPVLELRPFLDMLSWTNAADMFAQYGQAGPLRRILKEIQAESFKSDIDPKVRSASRLADGLDDLTTALSLNRVKAIPEFANRARESLHSLRTELSQHQKLAPFDAIAPKVELVLNRLSADGAEIQSFAGLKAMAGMIRQALEFGLIQQAATIAVEAAPHLLVVINLPDLPWDTFITMQRSASRILGERLQQEKNGGNRGDLPAEDNQLAALVGSMDQSIYDEIYKNWHALSASRNNINHAGYRKNEIKLRKLLESTIEAVQRMADLLETVADRHRFNAGHASHT